MNTQEKFTPTPYEVIEQKEVLHEAFAGLLADFHRLIDRDNNKGTLTLFEEVREIYNTIFDEKFDTMEAIIKLKGKCELFRIYLKGMNNE